MPLCQKHGHMVGEGSKCAECERELRELDEDTKDEPKDEPKSKKR
jgi:bacterioferritin-associated ferredoxin